MRVSASCLASVLWIGSLGSAIACDCGNPLGMRGDELTRWQLERATNVVRGRVVEIHADEKIVRKTWGTVAVAKLKVGSVIKGNVPGKVLTLVTASGGNGSCSLASVLLNTVGSRDDVILS